MFDPKSHTMCMNLHMTIINTIIQMLQIAAHSLLINILGKCKLHCFHNTFHKPAQTPSHTSNQPRLVLGLHPAEKYESTRLYSPNQVCHTVSLFLTAHFVYIRQVIQALAEYACISLNRPLLCTRKPTTFCTCVLWTSC